MAAVVFMCVPYNSLLSEYFRSYRQAIISTRLQCLTLKTGDLDWKLNPLFLPGSGECKTLLISRVFLLVCCFYCQLYALKVSLEIHVLFVMFSFFFLHFFLCHKWHIFNPAVLSHGLINAQRDEVSCKALGEVQTINYSTSPFCFLRNSSDLFLFDEL